jgi:zinc transport system substrate-binding protein
MHSLYPFSQRLLHLVLCLALITICHTPVQAAEPLRILAGTTLVEDIVADLGGNAFVTHTLIPGSVCPGHTDLKASDVSFAQSASAVLLHDWQRDMPLAQALLRSTPGAAAKLRVVSAPGNWMLPERQAEATRDVAKLLTDLAPNRARSIETKARERQIRIKALAARLKNQAVRAKLPGLRVICDTMQRPLLEWFGCVVVAEYGRFESMTPKQLSAVMTRAKEKKAVLVVDNMQSTGGSGKALAEELGAAHTVLTNFPGAAPGALTWEQTLKWDLERLVSAMAERG